MAVPEGDDVRGTGNRLAGPSRPPLTAGEIDDNPYFRTVPADPHVIRKPLQPRAPLESRPLRGPMADLKPARSPRLTENKSLDSATYWPLPPVIVEGEKPNV